MIITVTLNTSIDRTMIIPHFRWGETIRSLEAAVGMGGKGADASWILGELGIETQAMGFAAGPTGQQMEEMLQQRGVQTDFTWVEGDSRTNIIIIDHDGQQQSTITADSLEISPEHIQQLQDKYEESLSRAKSVIIGGSLPPGIPAEIYPEMIQAARKLGIPVVFDSSGATLRTGLTGNPSLIKPNLDELQTLVGKKLETIDQIYNAAREIQVQYGCIVIATFGVNGALALTDDSTLFIEPPTVNVRSSAGAGDAILAGAAHALAENLPLEEGLRLGFAAAASVLSTLATADCIRDDVDSFLEEVQIREYNGSNT
jgi:1-phosphofructokinase